ncbi:MAG: GTP-binding protein [Clostridiales bacterium]|jgi:GTP-binding protein|nr:GTP-binding protein [Clostridiales bacterium]
MYSDKLKTNQDSRVAICGAKLAATAVRPDQYPSGLPEFAFAGKSNVGKSSLINAMVNRNALARSSKQPGKTRTLNFYEVEYKFTKPASQAVENTSACSSEPLRSSLFLVDLPGYGYAKISKEESARWGGMVESYLKNRPPLKALFLLLDIRHEPNANDKMLYDWCVYYKIPLFTVATKSDKLKRSQVPKYLAAIRRSLNTDEPPLAFSSESRAGRDALWSLILDIANKPVL